MGVRGVLRVLKKKGCETDEGSSRTSHNIEACRQSLVLVRVGKIVWTVNRRKSQKFGTQRLKIN